MRKIDNTTPYQEMSLIQPQGQLQQNSTLQTLLGLKSTFNDPKTEIESSENSSASFSGSDLQLTEAKGTSDFLSQLERRP